MPGILWLASYPKSGNTWMRAFLANYFHGTKNPLKINELPKFVFSDSAVEHFEQMANGRVEHMSDREIHMLRRKVHEMFAWSGNDTVLVKTHNQIAFVDGVPTINPEATAGAIYMIRNPVDVCVSYAHHYGIDLDSAVVAMRSPDTRTTTGREQVLQFMGSWSSHVLSWITAPGLRLQVVRYEDLVLKPQETYQRLIKFLGLPLESPRLNRAIQFSSFKEMSKQEAKGGFIEQNEKRLFFRKGKVGDWRAALSSEQAQTIISDHREVMNRFGYLSNDGAPTF